MDTGKRVESSCMSLGFVRVEPFFEFCLNECRDFLKFVFELGFIVIRLCLCVHESSRAE